MDNYLEHYGVKGMKWGKRKQRPVPNKLLKGKPGARPPKYRDPTPNRGTLRAHPERFNIELGEAFTSELLKQLNRYYIRRRDATILGPEDDAIYDKIDKKWDSKEQRRRLGYDH